MPLSCRIADSTTSPSTCCSGSLGAADAAAAGDGVDAAAPISGLLVFLATAVSPVVAVAVAGSVTAAAACCPAAAFLALTSFFLSFTSGADGPAALKVVAAEEDMLSCVVLCCVILGDVIGVLERGVRRVVRTEWRGGGERVEDTVVVEID